MPRPGLQRPDIYAGGDLQRRECVPEAVRRDMRQAVFRDEPLQPEVYRVRVYRLSVILNEQPFLRSAPGFPE